MTTAPATILNKSVRARLRKHRRGELLGSCGGEEELRPIVSRIIVLRCRRRILEASRDAHTPPECWIG